MTVYLSYRLGDNNKHSAERYKLIVRQTNAMAVYFPEYKGEGDIKPPLILEKFHLFASIRWYKQEAGAIEID